MADRPILFHFTWHDILHHVQFSIPPRTAGRSYLRPLPDRRHRWIRPVLSGRV